jgi:hypothetical protein
VSIVLRPISAAAAARLRAALPPEDVVVAPDHPTDRARAVDDIERVIAHTPLDRPASGRVLEKAGFRCTGEEDDEHEGAVLRVRAWELPIQEGAAT